MSASRGGTPLESETAETVGHGTMAGREGGNIAMQNLPGTGPTDLRISVVKEPNGLLDPTPRGHYIEIAQRNQDTSPFLSLPPELRTNIYRLVCEGFIIRVSRAHRFNWMRGERAAWRIEFDTVRHSISFLRICRAIYAEARLIPFAEAHFDFEYNDSNSTDPIVQHMHQRYALRRSTLSHSAGTYVFKGRLRERLPARILPVQTNAITTIDLFNNFTFKPAIRTLMKDVACLPALRQINWYLSHRGFVADIKLAAAFQQSVGNSIRVVIKVPPSLESSIRGGFDDQQWELEKKILEQRAGIALIDWP
ncbi:hypothetical protein SLS60_005584 [Paraconiothyrium brasiliense]|uniref:Uncharacterized protein n=1 Tax=Paraconiothyrium brasiliense TaxID=300254 RepID=A0ABR3RHY2_9PLEO